MGAKKPVDMTTTQDEVKVVETDTKPNTKEKKEAQPSTQSAEENKNNAEKSTEKAKPEPKPKKSKKLRSKKYQAVRSKVDRTKAYEPKAAIELVKKLSYTKFAGTISAHLTVKEQGLSKEITFPHSTGQSKVVEIADENTLKKIEAGDIDFDILIAAPQFMSKLTKYAPILGPKGLMPNPKNGTLTPNPEQRQKELAAGVMTIRTEKKAPLIHVAIGKTDMDTDKLVENLQALVKAFQQKLSRVVISATMSPGVKVVIEKVE